MRVTAPCAIHAPRAIWCARGACDHPVSRILGRPRARPVLHRDSRWGRWRESDAPDPDAGRAASGLDHLRLRVRRSGRRGPDRGPEGEQGECERSGRGDPSERGREARAELFGENCAVCHTLAAANAVGKVGPNLDQLEAAVGPRAEHDQQRLRAEPAGEQPPGMSRAGHDAGATLSRARTLRTSRISSRRLPARSRNRRPRFGPPPLVESVARTAEFPQQSRQAGLEEAGDPSCWG